MVSSEGLTQVRFRRVCLTGLLIPRRRRGGRVLEAGRTLHDSSESKEERGEAIEEAEEVCEDHEDVLARVHELAKESGLLTLRVCQSLSSSESDSGNGEGEGESVLEAEEVELRFPKNLPLALRLRVGTGNWT